MVANTELLLSGLKVLTIAAGFYIVVLAFRAYRKNPQRPILWLSIGMLILTLGAISEGAVYQGLDWSLDQSHLFEAIVTLIGFLVLVYSVLVPRS